MEKIWLRNYPPGVPAQINPDEYSSIAELFCEACAKYRDWPAYSNFGTTLTYAQIEERSQRFAAWLQSGAKLERGDRVAIMMPNVMQYPIALFGALRAGMTVVNTNPLYTAHELKHQLKDSGAKVIVVVENFAHVLAEIIDETDIQTVVITSIGELLGFPKSILVDFVVKYVRRQVPPWDIENTISFSAVLNQGKFLPFVAPALTHEDVAFLQYTGGTTGIAKGAVLTHGNMVANVLQAEKWLGTVSGLVGAVAVTALPLYHIFSLTANCMAFTSLGGHILLITNPRDFPAFVKELSKYRCTYISGVNTLFNALLNTPGFDRVDFSGLKISLGGGMAVQKTVADRWKQVTGNVLTQAWGLTETSPAVCINPFTLQEFNGSIGLPISSTEVSARDDEGKELGINEVGELCVRGPQVMREYWHRPDETAKVMLPDGWLRTGDVGRIDERGYVFIEDRKKDMILVSGFNVYPNEVEQVASSHPGVREVAAVAQPSEHSGEVVALFVVKKDPNLTAEDLIAYCRKELTSYKVPRHVYFRDELPKTNVGKILRRALREELMGKGVGS